MTTPALAWPAEIDQMRITVPYNPTTGAVEIYAPKGTPVRATIKGTIAQVTQDGLRITTDTLSVTYSSLQNLRVKAGDAVTDGQIIAESGAAENLKLLVYQTVDPTNLFDRTAPMKAAAASAAPSTTKLYLKPMKEGLRLRETPVDGKPVGQLKLDEWVESQESEADTRAKVGVNGQWLKILRSDGSTSYTAAWLLQWVEQTFVAQAQAQVASSGSLTGMNLDIYHAFGRPEPVDMHGIGWVRIKFNVSMNPDKPDGDPKRYGNTDIEAAYQRYLPFIQKYHQAGMKILMVFTHQLYGEGAGFNWQQMDGGLWSQLTTKYADFARQVAQRFAGTGMINVYQIWNEQDTQAGRAAVAVPPTEYGKMLTETIRAIRTVDTQTLIITGGHTSGPESGSQYARQTLSAMPGDVRPDGLAFHPYGRGKAGHRFSNWGPLSEEIDQYSAVLPGKPLWITEWGVLDHQGRQDVIVDVTDYAASFMTLCKQDFKDKVAAAIWYAWADSMDNGFGLVDSSGKPKSDLHPKFRTLG